MKLYSINDNYISFLRSKFKRVYSNKIEKRIHTRKYLGAVFKIENYNYYIPLSSPKDSHDYIIINGEKQIRKDSIIVIRIVAKNVLKGTLQIGTMIPVPDDALIEYDVQKEEDLGYKELIQDEIIFIRKNAERIIKTAKLLYSKKVNGNKGNRVIDNILDFKALEKYCDNWK